MKAQLQALVDAGLECLRDTGYIPSGLEISYQIDTPKNPEHGDYSVNAAMLLARPLKRPPREIAASIVEQLRSDRLVAEVDIAGPGFINIRLAADAIFECIPEVIQAGERYGCSDEGAGIKVQVEFVSANPTGPLHVGHGRGAALGSVISTLLASCGYDVTREYYVNDAGRQMDILALSVYLRVAESLGYQVSFPSAAYQGEYVRDIANTLLSEDREWDSITPPEASTSQEATDDEVLDVTIAAIRSSLGEQQYGALRELAKDFILVSIQEDLAAFEVHYDEWYSERSLAENGLIEDAVSTLDERGQIYTREGAKWFRSASFDDEKDRVVIRENGQSTYFASDIAYHYDKYQRGFDHIINIWGADHHGYVPRVEAAVTALGQNSGQLEIVLVQFASLIRDGEKVSMSTRSGEFVTLKELVDEVGCDAARFFYVMRRAEQHMDFDLDLAKAESTDNPVYYVQYAHARICSVLRQLPEEAGGADITTALLAAELVRPRERELAMTIGRFPELIQTAAHQREPHLLTTYLRELANQFHTYYNAHRVLVDEAATRQARTALIQATKVVLANGLRILAVSAPEKM
ncbi:MAG: arginine--tRNA ligase [Gammaproteobacteria bacterium]